MTKLDHEDERICDNCYNLIRQYDPDSGEVRAYCYLNIRPENGQCQQWTKGMK